MTLLWIVAALFGVALLIVFGVSLAEQIGRAWGIRQGHRAYLAEERRANLGPPPGLPDRRQRDVGPGGRHRRTDADAGGDHTATGILRAVRATDDALPGIPRATRAQLREAGGR